MCSLPLIACSKHDETFSPRCLLSFIPKIQKKKKQYECPFSLTCILVSPLAWISQLFPVSVSTWIVTLEEFHPRESSSQQSQVPTWTLSAPRLSSRAKNKNTETPSDLSWTGFPFNRKNKRRNCRRRADARPQPSYLCPQSSSPYYACWLGFGTITVDRPIYSNGLQKIFALLSSGWT